jgi:hypothetical protein
MKNPPAEMMTLRDFFAATVETNDLIAIVDPESQKDLMGEALDRSWPIQKQIDFNMKMEARLRYAYADAMLAERSREK